MSIDPLIDRLSADLRPVRRRTPLRDAALLLLLGAVELAGFAGMGTMRPDLSAAMALPSFWWKAISLALIALVGGGAAILSLSPIRSPRRGVRAAAMLVLATLAAGWLVDAARAGGASLGQRLDPVHGIICATKIVLLSLPAVAAFGLLMRRGAPTDRRGSAAAAGMAAAAWGALVFMLACPFDDPLYVAVWYLLGGGVTALAARLVLPPLTRW
ncbi:DUF1109 domain-containing protein [Nguyenibacter sp. L1]|uniref:DUF1109 domain-containing protein n=1 Tax=Nguyenibacter sp. L1 TaxID=3049350 RepID=UPI002B46029D|nr:DUF1109 domain-containing protein [Nguyenibacter sp. L1]WRH88950.1 DUF1109 domain-containing protein [Nguyenibacter sp. L1]